MDPCRGGVTCMTKCIEEAVRGGFARQLFAIAGPIALLLHSSKYAKSGCLDSWFEKTVRDCCTVRGP